jgi:orotate phosphoribosyltransferase
LTADTNEDQRQARASLRRLLLERGFLYARDGHVLRSRSGLAMPWMLYSPAVSLTHDGLTLMSSVILEQLREFRSRQLATFGLSALPLLGACVAGSQGRYTGLIVRREAKRYGAARRIDGPLDRGSSVVLIDDAISSGTAMRDGIQALEAEGIVVEGAVAVVDFGAGVIEWLRATGYRVTTVFDVSHDLGKFDRFEAAGQGPAPMRTDPLPDGLAPAEAVRRVAEVYRATGMVPRPPTKLDTEYPHAGGVFVSVRRRSDGVRLVRTGLLEAVASAVPSVADAVVQAAFKACTSDPVTAIDDLHDVKFAVSLIGPAEQIQARDIDHRVRALTTRSGGIFARSGFALPNTPHYDDEVQQLRYTTRSLMRTQAYALFGQSVHRSIEPGEKWPEYGAPQRVSQWVDDPHLAEFLSLRIRQLLSGRSPVGSAMRFNDTQATAVGVVGIGVSLYRGRLIGCAVRADSDIDAAIAEATVAALADRRYSGDNPEGSHDDITAVVSLLYEPRQLGAIPNSRLHLYFRLGRDTLQARGATGSGLVLAQFAAQQGFDADAYRTQVLHKAGNPSGRVRWTAYDTASWIVRGDETRRLQYGIPVRDTFNAGRREQCVALAGEIADHVLEMRSVDGIPAYSFRAWTGQDSGTGPGTSTRILIAAGGLLECAPHLSPEIASAARQLVNRFIDKAQPGPPRSNLTWDAGGRAQLLRCLAALAPSSDLTDIMCSLAHELHQLIRHDGAIFASGSQRVAADVDILSGLVILALNESSRRTREAVDSLDFGPTLAFYRHRFALIHPWSMVWWHAQAWLRCPTPGAREFGFDIVDWALSRQSRLSGAFIIDTVSPYRNSFLTACVLEAVADAWRVAAETGDANRAAQYSAAWQHGITFVESLVLRAGDEFFIPNGRRALGGVRPTLVDSNLRIDYAGHALLALGKGLRAIDTQSN